MAAQDDPEIGRLLADDKARALRSLYEEALGPEERAETARQLQPYDQLMCNLQVRGACVRCSLSEVCVRTQDCACACRARSLGLLCVCVVRVRATQPGSGV